MTQFQHITLEELTAHPTWKSKLAETIGLNEVNFDNTLPNEWVKDFQAHCKKNDLPITYHLIVSSVFWVYDNGVFGYPVSGCSEVQWAIEAFLN